MLNIKEIKEILPHRYPFLLIDKILSISENHVVGLKNVSANEWYFEGHFPQEPVMPGVLQIEALAQVGAIAILNGNRGKIAYLAGVDKARFKGSIYPGDILEISVTLTQRKGAIGKGVGEIKVEGKKVMSAELIFAIK
jgi:hypothetical protein